MLLSAYRVHPYDHEADNQTFTRLLTKVRNTYEQTKTVLLIGNLSVGDIAADALLITENGGRIMCFCRWESPVVVCGDGAWTANGRLITGNDGRPSPLPTWNRLRQKTEKALREWLDCKHLTLKVTLLCPDNTEIDLRNLPPQASSWLEVIPFNRLSLNECSGEMGAEGVKISPEAIRSLPELLGLNGLEWNKPEGALERTEPASQTYWPEDAKDYYAQLLALAEEGYDPEHTYKKLNGIFQRLINQLTEHISIHFGGAFAKTDFLLKEIRADKAMRSQVNETRIRLRQAADTDDNLLKEHFPKDLEHIALFLEKILREPIPAKLRRKFIHSIPSKEKYTVFRLAARMIVTKWDQTFLYGTLDGITPLPLYKVRFRNEHGDDWEYLQNILKVGTQLNLVKPAKGSSEDELVPDLIVFEPDYLVDITTIASSFESYAVSPFVSLLKRIQPSPHTYATLLGNFAGQLLDESVKYAPGTRSYAQSAWDFFQHNAFDVLTTLETQNAQFHQDAQVQAAHIETAMHRTLPKALGDHFKPELGMVEPSFFSETLGLQGRMDYLQLDHALLLEQKSGKGAFPQGDYSTPIATQQHTIQIQLYMEVLRCMDGGSNHLQAYLLYSKYKQSLVKIPRVRALLLEAMELRNKLVWCENNYTEPGGYRLLEEIDAESFNQKRVKGKLWEMYQKPQIEAVLQVIQNASPLEKAYFQRFMTFVSTEKMLSKIGNKTKECSGFASIWHNTLAEKKQAGNIYDHLSLELPKESDNPIEMLSFTFRENANHDMANFRRGDVVLVYPYEQGTEPDLRKNIVIRCSIALIEPGRITLRLRVPQSSHRFFVLYGKHPWAVEHDHIEASFRTLFHGLYDFLCAPQSRRDLITFQRKPETDHSLQLNGSYDEFQEMALKVKQARDIFLIIGPPGTGKTSFGLMTTLKEELTEKDSHILLTAYTNRAVDEICNKLDEEGLDYVRIGGKHGADKHQMSELAKKLRGVADFERALHHQRIYVGTIHAVSKHLALLRIIHFQLAIVDEASQVLEPQLLPLLAATHNGVAAIERFVMIGDHKQLPAVVQQTAAASQVHDPLLLDISLENCRDSLFERLLRKYRHDESVVYLLTRQGRMHPKIAEFPNQAFYKGELKAVPLPHQRKALGRSAPRENDWEEMLLTRRVAFIAAEKPDQSASDKVNQTEALLIAALIWEIYQLKKADFDSKQTVGVIVPYRNQITTIRNALAKYGEEKLLQITIDTVERYQGSQRDYIVYGFTVQQYYQLKFLTNNVFVDTDGTIVDRKLNVAMTRAREGLYMVGNPSLLANNFTFKRLMDYCRETKAFFNSQKFNSPKDCEQAET